MAEHGYKSLTIAMPFGEYGQAKSPDPSVRPYLTDIIFTFFTAEFVQSGHRYTAYSTRSDRYQLSEQAVRYELQTHTTLGQLYHFLYGSDPTVISNERRDCRGKFDVSIAVGPRCRMRRHTSNQARR